MRDTGPLRPAPGRGPIFVVGAMGSGSTLIRLILDSHERIGMPQETGFMRAYKAHQFIPLKWSGRNWARRLGWSRRELDVELARFYDRIFRRYIEAEGKQRWGDKTPLHTWHVDAMARLFPDAAFIGMMRHPGGSVRSNMTRFHHSFRGAVRHVERYDREIARQAARHKRRFVIVRYEELVLRPEQLMRELLEWLGEPWSDKVLQHHQVHAARGGKRVVEGRSRIDNPIDLSPVDKWARTMSARRRKDLTDRLGRLGQFFGYAMDDPAVLAPLRGDGRVLIGGGDIDARIGAFPDLHLRDQPERPLAERFLHPGRVQLHAVGEAALREPVAQASFAVRAYGVLPDAARARLHPLARRARPAALLLRRRIRR